MTDERPKNRPDIAQLPAVEYNKVLQDTWRFFQGKRVRLKDGREGPVIGVDPRPMKGVPTKPGQDGNYLCISVPRQARPGVTPHENVYVLPDDVTIVGEDHPPLEEADVTTTTTANIPPAALPATRADEESA